MPTAEDRFFSLTEHLSYLERAIKDRSVILVVIDPLNAYLGAVNTWKDADVRRALSPLAAMAERTRCAIIGIVHLTKNEEQSLMNRVQGSTAFVAVARVVMSARKS